MRAQELLQRVRSLRSLRELPEVTYSARAQNTSCGDDLTLHLMCDDLGVVKDASFTGHGCALCLVSADDWCIGAIGKERRELERICASNVCDRLGFDPGPLRSRCAQLVIQAWKKIDAIWDR